MSWTNTHRLLLKRRRSRAPHSWIRGGLAQHQELFTSIRTSMPPENPNGLGAGHVRSDRRISSQGEWCAERFNARSRRTRACPSRRSPLARCRPACWRRRMQAVAGEVDVEDAAVAAGGDDDSTASLAPRSGLTVTGTVRNYSAITEEMLARPPDADWLMHYRNYAGLELQPAESDHPEERRRLAAEMGVAARRRNATADYAARARRRDVPVNEYDQHGPGAGRADGRPDLGASTGTDRDGGSERDADDGAVRQPVVLSGNRCHALRARRTQRERRLEEQGVARTPTTRSGES